IVHCLHPAPDVGGRTRCPMLARTNELTDSAVHIAGIEFDITAGRTGRHNHTLISCAHNGASSSRVPRCSRRAIAATVQTHCSVRLPPLPQGGGVAKYGPLPVKVPAPGAQADTNRVPSAETARPRGIKPRIITVGPLELSIPTFVP